MNCANCNYNYLHEVFDMSSIILTNWTKFSLISSRPNRAIQPYYQKHTFMQVALSFLRIFLISLQFFPVIKYNFIGYAGPASFAVKLLSSYNKNPNSIQQVLSLAQLSHRLSYILIPKLSLSHCQILRIIHSES